MSRNTGCQWNRTGKNHLLSTDAKQDSLDAIKLRLRRAVHAHFERMAEVREVPLKDGGSWTWKFINPNRLLSDMVSEQGRVQELYDRALKNHPPSLAHPWHMVIGWDELAPGNKLRIDNERKVMNLSFTFRELGQSALCKDWLWMTPVCVRTCILNKVRGGWAHLLKLYMECHLHSTDGIATAGVPIVIGGTTHVLFARVANLLSDGEGLQKALDWKGASSMKPCFLHSNVLKKDSNLAHRRSGYVEITCHDCSLFRARGARELAAEVDALALASDRVKAKRMTKGKFLELQMACGINWNPNGLLADAKLRSAVDIAQCVTMDWVHCLLQDGVFTIEAFRIIDAYRSPELNFSTVKAYLRANWCFPHYTKIKSSNLWKIFDGARASSSQEAEKLKASASECLGVYALLRHFLWTGVPRRPELALKHASFDAACAIIDIVVNAKREVSDYQTGAELLSNACEAHLRLHIEAYGTSLIKPKHHWLLDIPAQIRRDGMVLDAFVIERMHNPIKAIADRVKCTTDFEKSVLSEVVNYKTERSKGAGEHWYPHMPLSALEGTQVAHDSCVFSQCMTAETLQIATGDILCCGSAAGIVVACVAAPAGFVVVVRVLQKVGELTAHATVFQQCEHEQEATVWSAFEVIPAIAWYHSDHASIVVLH